MSLVLVVIWICLEIAFTSISANVIAISTLCCTNHFVDVYLNKTVDPNSALDDLNPDSDLNRCKHFNPALIYRVIIALVALDTTAISTISMFVGHIAMATALNI